MSRNEQARPASPATGTGQARAAVENLAAAKGPAGSSSGAAYVGGGLSAAAEHARAAVVRGEIAPSVRAEISDAIAGRSPPVKAGNGTTMSTGPAADSDTAEPAATVPPDSSAETDTGDMRADAILTQSAAAPSGSRPVNRSVNRSPTPGELAPQPPFKIRAPAAVAVPTPAESPVDADPLLDPDTLAAARNLRERFVGTLFGLAIGDAVAAATQFRRPGSFSPVGDMIGGGPFDLPRGAWSDDTAMALCLAESLLERDGFDARDQVERYSRWQQEGYLSLNRSMRWHLREHRALTCPGEVATGRIPRLPRPGTTGSGTAVASRFSRALLFRFNGNDVGAGGGLVADHLPSASRAGRLPTARSGAQRCAVRTIQDKDSRRGRGHHRGSCAIEQHGSDSAGRRVLGVQLDGQLSRRRPACRKRWRQFGRRCRRLWAARRRALRGNRNPPLMAQWLDAEGLNRRLRGSAARARSREPQQQLGTCVTHGRPRDGAHESHRFLVAPAAEPDVRGNCRAQLVAPQKTISLLRRLPEDSSLRF